MQRHVCEKAAGQAAPVEPHNKPTTEPAVQRAVRRWEGSGGARRRANGREGMKARRQQALMSRQITVANQRQPLANRQRTTLRFNAKMQNNKPRCGGMAPTNADKNREEKAARQSQAGRKAR